MFKITSQDKTSQARCGVLTTAHGRVRTPVFMPVGTLAAVKTMTPQELEACNVEMILSNAYHLYLRPGDKAVKKAGGLHKFMKWNKAILTDSGGYQVFSLAVLRKVKDNGVEFQSHIDGSSHFLTPEKVIEIQLNLNSDIMVPLDECPPYPADKNYAQKSLLRTTAWAERSKQHFENFYKKDERDKTFKNRTTKRRLLFGIIQGSVYPDLRKEAASRLAEIDFDGFCIGGLSVGEPLNLAYEIIESTVNHINERKPRYLMGVGTPADILECVERGIDMFDCVLPTRNGRNGTAFTSSGKINLRNAKFSGDYKPIEEGCNCYSCLNFNRAYIRHLFSIKEILGLRLVSLHNIYFYANLMAKIRTAISENRFKKFKTAFLTNYHNNLTNCSAL